MIFLSSKGGSLYPADSQVLIDSWLEVVETHYKVPFSIWTSPYLSKTPAKEEVVAHAGKDCKALLKELDGSLKKSPFLAGETLTIADISLASEVFQAFRLLVDENTRKGFKSTVEWILRVSQVEEFKGVWGDLTLCTVPPPVPVPGTAQEEVKKNVQQKKEKKTKAEVQVDKEAQAKKQQERKEKKEREAQAKLEAEIKKKLEEDAKASAGSEGKNEEVKQ
jgi:elongation factor 1-gamma